MGADVAIPFPVADDPAAEGETEDEPFEVVWPDMYKLRRGQSQSRLTEGKEGRREGGTHIVQT